jgi:hypothetical protein
MFVKRFVRIPARYPKLAGIPFFATLAMGEAVGRAPRKDASESE